MRPGSNRHRVSGLWALCMGLAVLALPVEAADTYTIDKEHTEVRFTWDHLGVSRQGGRFTDVSGTLEFDEAAPETSKVRVSIKLGSLSTGVAALDSQLLKTREFFDASKHPRITFESTEVRMTSARTGEVTGDLTINGISRSVVLAVVWNYSGPHPMAKINPAFSDQTIAGFSATTQIRRSDWGITRTVPFVSDEIQIGIETELKRTEVGQGAAAGVGVAPADTQAAPR